MKKFLLALMVVGLAFAAVSVEAAAPKRKGAKKGGAKATSPMQTFSLKGTFGWAGAKLMFYPEPGSRIGKKKVWPCFVSSKALGALAKKGGTGLPDNLKKIDENKKYRLQGKAQLENKGDAVRFGKTGKVELLKIGPLK